MKKERSWLYKALFRNDNSIIPLDGKATVLEALLNWPKGRWENHEKQIGILASEDGVGHTVTKLGL